MKEISNRSALFVTPKSPFKKWASQYNEEPGSDLEDRLNEKHVYLIDLIYGEDLRHILEPYYPHIFEYELLTWNRIRNEWPENRDLDLFLQWFDVTFCDDVLDLETEPIETEETDISKNLSIIDNKILTKSSPPVFTHQYCLSETFFHLFIVLIPVLSVFTHVLKILRQSSKNRP